MIKTEKGKIFTLNEFDRIYISNSGKERWVVILNVYGDWLYFLVESCKTLDEAWKTINTDKVTQFLIRQISGPLPDLYYGYPHPKNKIKFEKVINV